MGGFWGGFAHEVPGNLVQKYLPNPIVLVGGFFLVVGFCPRISMSAKSKVSNKLAETWRSSSQHLSQHEIMHLLNVDLRISYIHSHEGVILENASIKAMHSLFAA